MSDRVDSTPPSQDVLDAFGADGDPRLLDGGQGQTFRAGDVVLKPVSDEPSTHWIADCAIEVLKRFDPELALVYLPHLDYDLQRYGPDDPRIPEQVRAVDDEARATADDLPQGHYWVEVSGRSHYSPRHEVEILAGRPETIEIDLIAHGPPPEGDEESPR